MYFADPILSVGQAAGLYPLIATILAGSAFIGLMVYLTRPSPDKASADPPAVSLLSALIGLVVVAVLFAVLSSGPAASDTTYLGMMICVAVFALAILSMFHALALLASGPTALPSMMVVARIWTIVIGPTVGLLLVSTSAPDLFPIGLALSAVLIFVSSIGYWRLTPRQFADPLWPALPALLVAFVAALATGSTIVLLMQPATYQPPDALTIVVLGAVFGLMLAFSLLTAIAQPSERSGATSMAKQNGLPIAGSKPTSSYGSPRERADLTPALSVALAVVISVIVAEGRWTLLDSAFGIFAFGILANAVRMATVAGLRTPTLWLLAAAGGLSLTVISGFFLQLWAPRFSLPARMDPLEDLLLPSMWVVATVLLAVLLLLGRRRRQVKRSTPQPALSEISDNTVVLSDGPTIQISGQPSHRD
jgi:hypothetical protein